MQDANIEFAAIYGEVPAESTQDLIKALLHAGIDLNDAAKFLLAKVKELSNLKKSLTKEERSLRIQKAKALVSMVQDLVKAADIMEADASKKAHLGNPATRSFQRAHQKVNANIAPSQATLGTLLFKNKEVSAGDMARCARYCKDSTGRDIQGRNCPVCLGAGHSRAKPKAGIDEIS